MIAISAFLIAGSAAWFSVFGLSKLFAGSAVSVIIMAGSLEIGKLISVSFLYRYWTKLHGLMKTYLTIGVITLVLITSAGIFSFLSNAYQGATIGFEKEMNALSFNEDKLIQLEEDKQFLKTELAEQLISFPNNYITAKRILRNEYNINIQKLSFNILATKTTIADLKIKLVDTGAEVGPAIYLARVFNSNVDTVVKFFIFILIFVFDPMAIILVIAANMVLLEKYEKQKTEVDKMFDKYISRQNITLYGEDKKSEKIQKKNIDKEKEKSSIIKQLKRKVSNTITPRGGHRP